MQCGAIFHCMHKERSGFQYAEGQRHAALVAQREPGGQAMLLHPAGGPAAEAISRRTAFQPDSFDLAQGKRLPQTGARGLEKGFLGGKVGCRTGKAMHSAGP